MLVLVPPLLVVDVVLVVVLVVVDVVDVPPLLPDVLVVELVELVPEVEELHAGNGQVFADTGSASEPRPIVAGQPDAWPNTTYVEPAALSPPGSACGAPTMISALPSPLESLAETEYPVQSPGDAPSSRKPLVPSASVPREALAAHPDAFPNTT